MASYLQHMPDIVLLHIFNFLNTDDLLQLSNCCDRFQSLCSEKLIVRETSFEGCYHVKEEEIKKYIKKSYKWIQILNLNHCYWWPSRLTQWVITKCTDLRELHILECRIKVPQMVTLVAALSKLEKLSFSVKSINDLKTNAFRECSQVLQHLKSVYIYYASREMSLLTFLGEQTTMLDLCENLEEIYIGSVGMAIPELYRPIISFPQNFLKLKAMGITNNIHAGAQMLYYGTLSQIPNSDLHFKTLIMPNVNFPEFMQRSEYQNCLCHMEDIQHLDIYGSKVAFPMDVINIKEAVQLRHLSLGASRITATQLDFIANHCNKLTSINLFNCDKIFQGNPCYQGIEALFKHCPQLKHFNIAGEHHHINSLTEGQRVIQCITGLESLSVATCLLHDVNNPDSSRRHGKRSLSPRAVKTPTKRKCQSENRLSMPVICLSSDDDNSNPGASTRVSHVPCSSGNSSTLARLVEQNPELRTLEIVAANITSVVHQNKYINPKNQTAFDACSEARLVRDIEYIQHLNRLESLTLMGLPGLLSGTCLSAIFSGCSNIKTLYLGYLGSAFNGLHFSEALKHCQSLEDLRIEQPNLLLKSHLFEGLASCQKLQRLCIFAKNSTFQATDVVRMMEQLPLLVVLQLLSGNSLSACKTLTTTLNKKFKSRVSLAVCICPLLQDGITAAMSQIPAKHFQEVTRFSSRVASFPPGIKI